MLKLTRNKLLNKVLDYVLYFGLFLLSSYIAMIAITRWIESSLPVT